MSTAMYCAPYYDEKGQYHHHDMNIHSKSMRCSRGHEYTLNTYCECACGWVREPSTIVQEK